MELGVREWMIIVGVLLILAVLLDGYRRMRNERRGNIRISLNKQFLNSVDELEESSSELPSGGARAVGRRRSQESEDTPSIGDGDLGLEQSVPMLMESVVQPESDFPSHPEEDAADLLDYDPLAEYHEDDGSGSQPIEEREQVSSESADYDQLVDDGTANDNAADQAENFEVVVINVVAKGEPFKGPDLLHILLACDLRFGDKNIFHRHEDANGRGAVQFSMANSVEPGYFDLDAVDDFTTPGVCFFMSVPGPKESIKAFECMVETAQCLVTNLEGELLDESRSAMTNQTLEHCRLRLQEFERLQLAHQV